MKITPYIKIARPDHWFKNVFMLPGIVLVVFFSPTFARDISWLRVLLGLVSACLVASSNYVLNEILDRDKDKFHPEKRHRPVPSGQIRLPLAYAEWLILAIVGIAVGFGVNRCFGVLASLLWIAGTLYNIPPVRTKEITYIDVLSESVNNPLRLAMGWYATGYMALPPLSVVLAYWMFGAFLMAMKRYAEYRRIGDHERATQYRRSFAHYSEERLIESLFFYGSLFGMLSGIFMARYHVELVLATPIVALALAYYMHLGFKPNSPVQHPERLFRQKKLMGLVLLAFLACAVLLAIEIPAFRSFFTATPVEP
jgi:decaprenyl-phosphate phosphoribosyltransferase